MVVVSGDEQLEQKKYKRGLIRQENERIILTAAAEEFVLNGFRGTSMNAISERSGLPKANLHYYFSSKLGLYGAVLREVLELWDATFNELTADDDPAQSLSRYVRGKVMFSRDNPLASRLFAIELISGGEHLSEYFGEDYRLWFAGRAQVFKAWIDAGKMDAVDPNHLIFMIWASTQHYADFSSQVTHALGVENGLDDEEFERAADTLCHIILKGCGISSGVIGQSE
ncbi:HTH-type transcriptional regulator RutR [Sinobacterium norvegicum]|uniref:HTH-type transcriptional regulator RutR n=1 Tax=Sinobacterium norvegicum TaxID=1641715 RepID=A0ABN8EG19_9GAMM|nr:TetR/AcrR family transcriptional regulator [Sinobacterium norvegicum]CAH0991370.1 HTH-type transcriptional regulator RutR [Sinobacterium norvegicum]